MSSKTPAALCDIPQAFLTTTRRANTSTTSAELAGLEYFADLISSGGKPASPKEQEDDWEVVTDPSAASAFFLEQDVCRESKREFKRKQKQLKDKIKKDEMEKQIDDLLQHREKQQRTYTGGVLNAAGGSSHEHNFQDTFSCSLKTIRQQTWAWMVTNLLRRPFKVFPDQVGGVEEWKLGKPFELVEVRFKGRLKRAMLEKIDYRSGWCFVHYGTWGHQPVRCDDVFPAMGRLMSDENEQGEFFFTGGKSCPQCELKVRPAAMGIASGPIDWWQAQRDREL